MLDEMSKLKYKKAQKKRNRNNRRAKQKAAATKSHSTLNESRSSMSPPILNIPCQEQTVSVDKNISSAMELWYNMYVGAVKWHSEHQLNFWRKRAEYLERENEQLRWKREQAYAEQYETSSDEDVEEESGGDELEPDSETEYRTPDNSAMQTECVQVDDEYLEFLSITHKHRAELKMTRRREATEASSATSDINQQSFT